MNLKLRVGQTIRFRLGSRVVLGVIREDRGPIGVGGRHLYLISYELGKDNPYMIELPADEFEIVTPNRKPA